MRRQTLQLLKIANILLAGSVLAQDKPESSAAMLFAHEEQVLADNILPIMNHAAEMPLSLQLDYLADWVLPTDARPTFRMNGVFTHSAPLAEKNSEAMIRGIRSPVFTLIHAAQKTQRLVALRQRIEAIPDSAEPDQLRAKKALLFMVCNSADSHEAATKALVGLLNLVPERERNRLGSWWPETLALAYGMDHRRSDPVVFDLATTIYESQIRQGIGSGNIRWDVFAAACFTEFQSQPTALRSRGLETDDLPHGLEFSNWDATSTFTAESRGQSLPPAVWRPLASSTQKVGGHNNDMVYLPTPLLGDFEIQCDVTSFDYREIAMAYAGQYASHHWKLTGVEVGTIRDFEILPLHQPMTNPDAWLSSRIIVRDGISTHYLNGHQVLQRTLPPGQFPWIGIRTNRLSQGSARKFTLRGTPVVPESINLSSDPGLAGWYSHFDETVADITDQNSWNLTNAPGEPPEIRHKRNAALAGSLSESALSYHRPMAEDGVISYEFFYEADSTHVHPVLGQLAFVLQPVGVQTHKITDGKWQLEGIPSGVASGLQRQSGLAPLPLKNNTWNQLQFLVQGNILSLVLNGNSVFEHEIDASNSRQFGLFHYSDQTSARIRNMQWKGDWLKSVDLPQALTAERADTAKIEQAASALTQSYQQQLIGLGSLSSEFIHRGGPVKAGDDGLVTESRSINGRHHSTDAPLLLKIEGDFDLRASFQDFQHTSAGDAGLELLAILPGDGQKVRINRHRWDNKEHKLRTRISAITNAGREKQREVDHWSANQASAGTFRMVRIGTALHYMFAEGDSSVYRLLSTDAVGRGPIPASGICLTAFADKGGAASATWTSVSVRAERVSGVAIPNLPATRELLNIQSAALTKSVMHDFSRQPPDSRVFTRWTDGRPWNTANKGLLLNAVGSDRWESSGLSTPVPVVGDFDIRLEFDQLDLAKPANGHQTTLSLEIQPTSQPETMLNCMLGVNSAGTIEAEGYARIKMEDGSHWYSGTERYVVRSATALRIARRGNRYFQMVRAVGEQHDRIVSISDHSDAPIGRVQVSLHTGGTERESNVRLKSLQIRSQ